MPIFAGGHRGGSDVLLVRRDRREIMKMAIAIVLIDIPRRTAEEVKNPISGFLHLGEHTISIDDAMLDRDPTDDSFYAFNLVDVMEDDQMIVGDLPIRRCPKDDDIPQPFDPEPERTCAYPDCTYYKEGVKHFCCNACACDYTDWLEMHAQPIFEKGGDEYGNPLITIVERAGLSDNELHKKAMELIPDEHGLAPVYHQMTHALAGWLVVETNPSP